mgnify:CR=1 FL=1
MSLIGDDHHGDGGAVGGERLNEGRRLADQLPKGPVGGDKADDVDGNVEGGEEEVAEGEVEDEKVGPSSIGPF